MNCIRFCMATLAFSTLMLVGCGDGGSGNSVKGTIKFSDGTPVTSGSVTFESDSFNTFGAINPDGTVEVGLLDGGVPDGTYTVTVSSTEETGTGEAGEDGESDYGESIELVAENSTQVTITGNSDFSVTVEKPGGAAPAPAPETAPETETEPTE